jgi:hypothetical protein
MGLLDKFFKKEPTKSPEEEYTVTITDEYIQVMHPRVQTGKVLWKNINSIKLVNTDEGPWNPDIWLILFGDNENEGCVIPHGAKGFDEIYEVISKYDNFNFENFEKSMTTSENAVFDLWKRK